MSWPNCFVGITIVYYSLCTVQFHISMQKIRRQRTKRKSFRERKKAQKAARWEEKCNEALRKRWRENAKVQELNIEEKEECKKKREAMAAALEATAVNIRKASSDAEKINDHFLCVSDQLKESDTGTLNLPSCHSLKSATLLQTYKDMAEYYRPENRRLKVKASESIEAVRKFCRNYILEHTRAGRMVMISLRKSAHIILIMCSHLCMHVCLIAINADVMFDVGMHVYRLF